MAFQFINRDISWLYFNRRVLEEAARTSVPAAERLNFLSIYSSNLDEFSRVRVPAHMLAGDPKKKEVALEVQNLMFSQQEYFGSILSSLIQELQQQGVLFIYNRDIPPEIMPEVSNYFYSYIAAYMRVMFLQSDSFFFPENNYIYIAVLLGDMQIALLPIPSDKLPRFFTLNKDGKQYVLFIDDIIKAHLSFIFADRSISGAYSFKVSRDAELGLSEEEEERLASKLEKRLSRRELGLVSRLLYDAKMPEAALSRLIAELGMTQAMIISGGSYHNLKDLSSIKLGVSGAHYAPWVPRQLAVSSEGMFSRIAQGDMLLHLPFHSYNTILRFFNEAALDPAVTEINMTVYRLATTSLIAESLITAALSGKRVNVFVELKARFDEANNINWARKMKAAGVKVIYSIPGLKVHAKVALVKRKTDNKTTLFGLLGTGNFNEVKAAFYTDHMLLTADLRLLKDLDNLFSVLKRRRRFIDPQSLTPKHLLIAPFNMQPSFEALIDREIQHAKAGKKALMIVKVNNLEDKRMISKLYDASNAGVSIRLIVRGICRLAPGVEGQSSNIVVHRVIDRYLEHGRIFYFLNDGFSEWFLGSADWMSRNLYRRVEVAFPVYSPELQAQLSHILDLYWSDNVQAVKLAENGDNLQICATETPVHAQQLMYHWVTGL